DLTIAVVVGAVARLLGRDEGARIFALLVAIEIVIPRLATCERAGAGGATPDRVDRSGIAIVRARTAVIHVGLKVRLIREQAVAVRIDAARIGRRGWADRADARHAPRRAGLRSGLARAGRSGGRRRRDITRTDAVGGRLIAGLVDRAVAVVVDAVTD